VGGGNYISQYFHYGHLGIDIAATYGTPIVAPLAGVVVFAGWKSNGGGYQVWISHGNNLYTMSCHMSGVTVSTGQSVGRGQGVGRVGMSGWATGPHDHFAVSIGYPWGGGSYFVNPLNYY
jgi:murein DD-endopeptidase MepM/ murein hydrolase activator NlpD